MDYFQEECKKLQVKAEDLAKEISTLRAGLLRVSEECGKLTEENRSIMVSHLNLTNVFCGLGEIAELIKLSCLCNRKN